MLLSCFVVNRSLRAGGRAILVSLGVFCGALVAVYGQTGPVSPPATRVDSTTQPLAAKAVPLPEVVSQADAVLIRIKNMEDDIASVPIVSTVESKLPPLVIGIDAKSAATATMLESRPSLDALRNLDGEWQNLGSDVPGWSRELTVKATQLDRYIASLTELGNTWNATLTSAGAGPNPVSNRPATAAVSNAPAEIIARIRSTIQTIDQTRQSFEQRRLQVLTLQNRVAQQDARVTGVRASIERLRQETVSRLFVKDSPAIWSGQLRLRAKENLWRDTRDSFAEQFIAVGSYALGEIPNFIVQAIVVSLLIPALYWARRRIQPWLAAEPALLSVSQIFDRPVSTAFVFTILISGRIHPQAPQLFAAFVGAAALVPTVIILRHIVERHLRPIFSALVVFYLMDLLRRVALSLTLLSRILFLIEMLGGIAFLLWLTRSGRLSQVEAGRRDRIWTLVQFSVRAALPVFGAAFIANALGYISLSGILERAVLGSAYLAAILLVAVRIADGLVMFAFRMRPLSLLGSVSSHRPILRRRIHKVMVWGAVLLWVIYLLDQLSLRTVVAGYIELILTATLHVGKLQFTVGAILAFILVVWSSFLLSRFVLFILAEDVYPRVTLTRGVPYAVSTILQYLILLFGFLFAVAAVGVDLAQFSILAGAFGVGLGFGLQNIFNNFVSGIILLFEQPIKVGDVIQLGEHSGNLRHIGLRASIMRTWEGSEVILPNSSLISGEVTNWTLSDQQRRMDINVGVAYGSDPKQIIALLAGVAAAHPDVVAEPPVDTLFTEFGDSALMFQLRAWTDAYDRWMKVKSDLTTGINAALQEAGISIPFPQRDLHIQSLAPEILAARPEQLVGPTDEE